MSDNNPDNLPENPLINNGTPQVTKKIILTESAAREMFLP